MCILSGYLYYEDRFVPEGSRDSVACVHWGLGSNICTCFIENIWKFRI